MTDHRSAITGEFVTAEHAAENPDTTVSEQRTRRPASDYAELRKLAEACPMPDNDPDTLSEWYELKELTERNYPIPPIDAAFIAACSPTVVLELLANLDHLRTEDIPVIQQRRDELIARVAELEGLVGAEYAGRNRLAAIVRSIRAYCETFVEGSEDRDPEPWNPAAYVLSILDGGDDANSNSKPQLGVGLEPIAFDPPLTDDEAGAFLDAITTDEADQ